MDAIYNQLKTFGHLKTNIPLSKFTTFRIGGPAQFLVEVTEEEKLIELLNFVTSSGLEYFVLGGGSNILFPDNGFEGVVIKISTNKIEIKEDNIIAAAGTPLGAIVNAASKNELTGMEWAVGIPGTVGGAIRGNAGAMGKETSDCLKSVIVWQDGEIKEMINAECGFHYRGSNFKDNGTVVLSATFALKPGNKTEIMQAVQMYIKQRTGRYPKFPSAGSFFQNINIKDWPGDVNELPELFRERGKVPVGWIIEQCGLKGYTVGGAKISDEHGNFLINFKDATQADVLKVVEEAQAQVYNKFRVNLEPEVEIIL
jgi:UDP-N-acetylmuramate dehydrogenase